MNFFLSKLFHIGIIEHLLRFKDIALCLSIIVIERNQWLELSMFAIQLAIGVHIVGRAFLYQELANFD